MDWSENDVLDMLVEIKNDIIEGNIELSIADESFIWAMYDRVIRGECITSIMTVSDNSGRSYLASERIANIFFNMS